jgi:hypothetical protein
MQTLVRAFIFPGLALFAVAAPQAADLEEARKYVTVVTGEKALKKPDPQFMPYLALKFRTGTTKIEGEERGAVTFKSADVAKASAFAVLEGVDESVFQEITDAFYASLTAKLATVGVPYAEMEKIKATKSFGKLSETQEERRFDHPKFGTSQVFTAGDMPFFKYPTLITKVMGWQKEMGAGLSTLRLTVDFVAFDISIERWTEWGFHEDKIHTQATSSAAAAIRIENVFQEATMDVAKTGSYFNMPGLILTNKKLASTMFGTASIVEPYKAEVVLYDDKAPEFAGKKLRAYGGDVNFGTYVIKADPEDFKRAAIKALDRYAEYVAVTIASYGK